MSSCSYDLWRSEVPPESLYSSSLQKKKTHIQDPFDIFSGQEVWVSRGKEEGIFLSIFSTELPDKRILLVLILKAGSGVYHHASCCLQINGWNWSAGLNVNVQCNAIILIWKPDQSHTHIHNLESRWSICDTHASAFIFLFLIFIWPLLNVPSDVRGSLAWAWERW